MISGNWYPGAKTLSLSVDGTVVTENVVSVTLTDDINGTDNPKIGSTVAARLTMVIQDPTVAYADKQIAPSMAGIPLGVFTVADVAAKDGRATIEAMDAMATAFEGEYTPAAASSTALTVIRDICTACGVPAGDLGLTDVPVTRLKTGHTCREMLGLMAALLGRNAHIDRYGRLCLRWYAASGKSVTADDYYPGALTMQDADYSISRIECTVRRTTDTTSEGVTTEETETTVYAAGTGDTGISITDDYMTQDILDGVYSEIGGLTYRPMSVTFYGDARIEAGDIITVTDTTGTAYTVPVMAVTHVWDGGVKTTVKACGNPSSGMSRSSGGYLSKSVSNLMAEFARFQNLEADNLTVLRQLNANWAKIGTLIAQAIEAAELNADNITAGALTVKDVNGNILLQADVDNNTVQIGGFTVEDDNLASTTVEIKTSEINIKKIIAGVPPPTLTLTEGGIRLYGSDAAGIGIRGYIGTMQQFNSDTQDGHLHISAVESPTASVTPKIIFDIPTFGTLLTLGIDSANYGAVEIGDSTTDYKLLLNGQDITPGGGGADPSATTPLMDGTAAVGSETAYARGDHRHPTDTTRAPNNHRSSGTTYGVGTETYYGHLRLSAATNSTLGTGGGTAATPSAVKAAYDLADSKAAKKILLWTNPSPSAAFAAQLIAKASLPSGFADCNLFTIIYRDINSEAYQLSETVYIPSGSTRADFMLQWVTQSGSTYYSGLRVGYVDTSEGIRFYQGRSGGSASNYPCVPVYIIGETA